MNVHARMTVAACLLIGTLLPTGAAALSDPTRPWTPGHYGKQAAHAGNGWTLDSLLVSPGRRVAIINGQYVSEGERVGNATVVSIRQSGVVLRNNGKHVRLRLIPDIVKQHP